MGSVMSRVPEQPDTIGKRRDPLRRTIWGAALALAVAALAVGPGRVWPAAKATTGPFLTLAIVITAAAIADRLGLFRLLARTLIPTEAGARISFAAVLGFTALLSGLVNLDVAVVVTLPVGLRVAERSGSSKAKLAAAVALTANATSFLLPTSNLTNLLVLTTAPLPAWAYLQESWVAWLLVSGLSVGGLTFLLGGRSERGVHSARDRGSPINATLDLGPMFVGASAIRALLGGGLVLHGGFLDQVAFGGLIAAGANNLPTAAAVHAIGPTGRWAAIVGMAIGPNLLVTGSIATLICRRIARDAGVGFKDGSFSLLALTVVPLEILAAAAGLHTTGVLR